MYTFESVYIVTLCIEIFINLKSVANCQNQFFIATWLYGDSQIFFDDKGQVKTIYFYIIIAIQSTTI